MAIKKTMPPSELKTVNANAAANDIESTMHMADVYMGSYLRKNVPTDLEGIQAIRMDPATSPDAIALG